MYAAAGNEFTLSCLITRDGKSSVWSRWFGCGPVPKLNQYIFPGLKLEPVQLVWTGSEPVLHAKNAEHFQKFGIVLHDWC